MGYVTRSTTRAIRDAKRVNLVQHADLATLRGLVRRWGACEVLTLNLEPLDFVEDSDENASGVQMRDYSEVLNAQTVQQLGQLQQLGLCLALQEAEHDETYLGKLHRHELETVIGLPWVQALLTAPCALRLLSLEIHHLPALPHFEGLHHLLLFVRRMIEQSACDAIAQLHALETLSVTGAQRVLENGEDRLSMAMPALDLRSCRRLRAVAFFDAVPKQLQLPDACYCSVDADSEMLDSWWAKDTQRCHDAVTLYADEQSDDMPAVTTHADRRNVNVNDLKTPAGAWLETSCARLTLLEIVCKKLLAQHIDLPALRELYVDATRFISISFRSPLRLTALSLVTQYFDRFDFDGGSVVPGLAQHLTWFHLSFQQECGGAAFLERLQDACKARGLPRWHMQEEYYENHEDPDGLYVVAEYRAVLAYFPVRGAASPEARLRGRCWCGGACHKCLKAAGIMHAEVCMPALPIMVVDDLGC